MSDETFKPTLEQSGRAGVSPSEAEYNAVYAAVTATERGRWFLAEFANRNRKADTDVILAAVARVEAAIGAGAAPQATIQATMQPTLPREDATAPAAIEPPRQRGERDEDVVDEAPAQLSVPEPPLAEARRAASALSDEDYSDAVAAIAASLTTRLEESAQDLVENVSVEDQNLVEDAAVNEPQREGETLTSFAQSVIGAADLAKPEAQVMPQGELPQDNSPRWYIEGPDFVFGKAGEGQEGGQEEVQEIANAALAAESSPRHAQLLGAELMPERAEMPAAPREEPVRLVTSLQGEAVFAASEEAMPAPISPPALEIVPLTEISRPPLRLARETALAPQRAPRFGSLTVTDALSEDEVIALFG